ncbi:MAG: beta-N-acetylhexosaminidase [Syntrophobacterales bacterium]|jgi:beta-N-acetylhexosaminidase
MAASGNKGELSSVGPLFMVGLPGVKVDQEARELVRELRVGGIILFARNLETPEQVWELTRDLQQEARDSGDLPLLIAVDQEGGSVQRLKAPFTLIPAGRDLGQNSTAGQVEDWARTVGRELALVGINMNLAPVLDVARTPRCPLWDRSFGSDPEKVAALGEAAIRGYGQAKVLPVAKHFPGLGDTSVDSHQVLPTAQDPDPERTKDLLPFRRAMAAGVPAVMTAHLHVPLWDGRPASLSSVALMDWLRQRLGYQGVIITDDLEMGAIATKAAVPEAVCQALAAGSDLLLVCSPGPVVWEAAAQLSQDQGLQRQAEEAKRRVQALRQRLSWPAVTKDEVRAYFQKNK